ncbi:MAG: hypothetical protein EPN45_15680 [Rhizobiaceae bacterium]|nr:MAG: hypothetical protein EPN45_15680 [Rhizobiaceae bacterium]
MASPFGVFSPNDLEFLQGVYDEVTENVASIDDMTMSEIASQLLDAHQSGVRDRGQLLGIARRALFRRIA